MFSKTSSPLSAIEKAFNGSQDHETASIPLTGDQVFSPVQRLNTIFGKTQKKEKIRLAYGRKGRFCLILCTCLI